jgi:hypothetical protein
MSALYDRACDQCGGRFFAARSHARFCGSTCRSAAVRQRDRETVNALAQAVAELQRARVSS